MSMSQEQTPNWRSIEEISIIAFAIDGLVESTEEQHTGLLAAREKPHVLDTPLVERIERLYVSQSEDFWFFNEQLSRWRKTSLNPKQETEVARLKQQMQKLEKLTGEILALIPELKAGTINKILDMSDEELAMAMLSGQIKPPF